MMAVWRVEKREVEKMAGGGGGDSDSGNDDDGGVKNLSRRICLSPLYWCRMISSLRVLRW